MITEQDILTIKKLQKFLNNLATNPIETSNDLEGDWGKVNVDWEKVNWIELLDKLVYNLQIAPFSYREISDEDKIDNYFTAECNECGWFGSSKHLLGGYQIADTGDYGDCFCPVCGNKDI